MNFFPFNRRAVDENEAQKKAILNIKEEVKHEEVQPKRGLAERKANIPTVDQPKEKIQSDIRFGGSSCLISPDEADDIDSYMRHLEKLNIVPANFLQKHKNVNGNMRQILVDWLFHVQRQLGMLSETMSLAVHVLDRSLLAMPDINKNNLQLLGVACLYTATKFEEICVPHIDDFVHIAADVFTKDDIFSMEQKVLQACNYELGHPHSIQYLRRYRFYVTPVNHVYQFAKYICEVALVSYELVHHPPSVVAAVAIWLASYTFGRPLVSDKLFAEVFKLDKETLVGIANSFVEYVIKFADPVGRHYALRHKYQATIDLLTEPHIARLRDFSDYGFSFTTKSEF